MAGLVHKPRTYGLEELLGRAQEHPAFAPVHMNAAAAPAPLAAELDELALELDAVPRLNRAIRAATEAGDNGSRDLFEKILTDEEGHIDWLEAHWKPALLSSFKSAAICAHLVRQAKLGRARLASYN